MRVCATLCSLVGGVLFAMGLGIGGMTQPKKVIGFLDIFGNWDPTLIFVMIGAIAVYASSYPFINRRRSPIWGKSFHVPGNKRIDKRLLAGAFIFGLGWGLAGFCPGPGLAAMMSGMPEAMVFVASMATGMIVFQRTPLHK